MSDLSNKVYDYYIGHFSEMPPDKQFHFASRLYLWDQDGSARQLLDGLKPYFTGNNQPDQVVQALITEARAAPTHGSKNAGRLRAPYFERYPQLKAYVTVLFRLNFLQTIYGQDHRDLFHRHFQPQDIAAFTAELLADPQAIAILSTHAVNFLYLYNRLISEDEAAFDPGLFLDVGRSRYDMADPTHLQLYIYLYTHCIIGESRFYYRALPDTYRPVYLAMIEEMETAIGSNFSLVNLDNKFEFLVCAKLMGVNSRLEERIFEEARRSLSDTGDFLIDRHNKNPQTANVSLDKSEHRNVLFIMAGRDFKPLG